MTTVKFAAIDIGSNAVRLLLSRVFENGGGPLVKKESLVRVPIRLGEDVFADQQISNRKRESLIETMIAFKHLMTAYRSVDYLACATSAMREAINGEDVAREIRERTGVELAIIDGRREAEIICLNRPRRILDDSKSYLFVDVGGSSTELVIFSGNEIVTSRSFDIGGIRILQGRVKDAHWKEMKRWLKKTTRPYVPLIAIGSGGNINKIFRLARRKDNEYVSYKKIKEIHDFVRAYSIEERIRILQLRPDRADVIVPAADIYLSVMRWAGCKKMFVPLAGLSDGLIHILYQKHKSGNGSDEKTAARLAG
jgi:exopolyphosphatase/guanosine-5'-triphosphate,3'-diphosphate pyrophosphatase